MRQVISTEDFTYHEATRAFVADRSDIPVLMLMRTFYLKSAKTSKEVQFSLIETRKDRENEVTLWRYASVGEVPELYVEIHND